MNWVRSIAKLESDMEKAPGSECFLSDPQRVSIDRDYLRKLFNRAYTEGFGEGLKRGRKQDDTHVMIKFLTEPTS